MENIKNNNNVDKTMKLKIIKNYIYYPKQIKGLKKNCYYCYNKNKLQKETIFFCEKCDKVLHLECFETYHKNYVYI